MKAVISLITFAFALSLCNLMGRRGNTNTNVNAPSHTSQSNTNRNSNNVEIVEAPPPPESLKPQHANSNAGVPQIETGPPPPPKQPKPTPLPIVSGGVLNGKAIKLVQPPYPATARAAHAHGQVTVQVLLDENGNVISATPVSGHPLLQGAAVAAARASKFSPTKLSGQPVKVSGVVIFNFVER